MMKKNLTNALLLMAALSLAGCSDNLTEGATTQVQDGKTEGCVTFKVSNIGSETRATRAEASETLNDSFNEGDPNEWAITTSKGANVAFFFGSDNKTYQGMTELQVLSQPEDVEDDHATGGHTSAVEDGEKYFSAYIKKAKDESTLECVVILNANPALLSKFNLTEDVTTLAEFLKEMEVWSTTNQLLGRYTTGGTTYFTMSNTVYTNNNKEILGAITIDDNNIYDTPEEALANPVTIHVERVVAKFTLNFKDKNDSDLFGEDGIITASTQLKVRTSASEAGQDKGWGIRVLGWNVNATETETYWVKNLLLADGNTVFAADGKIGNWSYEYKTDDKGWNDISRLRSYWAVDPHYNNNEKDYYPQQYREAKDEAGIASYDPKSVLNYIPYTAIGTDLHKAKYAPENTFGKYDFMKDNTPQVPYAYKGSDYKRPATHILIAAELLLDGELAGGEITDKYCYQNNYWVGTENNAELIKYMVEQLRFVYSSTLYTDENGENEFLPLTNAEAYFDLTAAATTKGGDGRVMLTLKSGAKLYQEKEEGTYELVTQADLQNAIYAVGTAKHFTKGMMYYAVPIEHMTTWKRDAENSNANQYNIGSFGVVRNHWYNVNIRDIASPGTSVDDPDQPIIPNEEPDEGGFISFEIVIIPWHVIDWSVDL